MIDFTLSENDRKVLDYVRQEALVSRKYARYYDEHEHEFPPDELEEAGDFPGVYAVMGGRSDRDTSMATMSMLISMGQYWGDYSVRVRQGRGGLGNAALAAAGTPEQKEKFGKLVLAMAITEPGCGSDPSKVQTTAVLDGDEWVLNGEKIFVTTGCRADGVVVWATLDRSAGRAGIKSFLVEKGTPGFIVAHKEKKLGIRADDTAAYVFQDCRIPRANLLGGNESVEPKKGSGGFKGVMKTFNMTRPGVAAMGLGMAEAALDFTRDALREAGFDVDAYGSGIGSQSAVVEKFQRLEAMFEAARLTVLRAAWLSDQGKPNNLEASISKAKGGASVRLITQGCIEILGPLGVSREHLLEKWFRDVRITDIYEGTQQIQHLIIARTILGYTRADLK
jgi:acyl-CoA dehydrogenase